MVGKWAEKRLRNHSNIVGCFCFAENRGMCYLLLNCWFFFEWIGCNRNRDQQKIVDRDRKLKWRCVFYNNLIVIFFWRLSVFIVIFPFLWWNKTDKCIDLWLFSSVVVLLLCIRPIDHAGGLCMSPILLYRENWVRIVLFVSKPVDVVFVGFELIRWNLFARFAWLFVST